MRPSLEGWRDVGTAAQIAAAICACSLRATSDIARAVDLAARARGRLISADRAGVVAASRAAVAAAAAAAIAATFGPPPSTPHCGILI